MIFAIKTFSFLILSSLFVLKANGNKNSTSIIIIGAGASGIAAASKLLENGFKNIKILEAENRIGGRVYTTQFGGYSVDIGGQWVHGEAGNVGYELAWPLGLLEKKNTRSRLYNLFDSSGQKMEQSPTNHLYKFYRETANKLNIFSEKNKNISKGYYFTKEFDKYFKMHPKWKGNEKGILHLLNMYEMSDDAGETWWNVSVTTNSAFYYNGDYLINWKDRGYSTLLDIVMKRYPNPKDELPVANKTILNTEVSLIDYSNKNEKVTIKTTNGKTYSADHVIVTCSLGVLKDRHKSLFKPPLSLKRQKTIEALGFGYAAKIILSYEKPWWPQEKLGTGLAFLWKDEDLKMIQNDPEKRWLHGLMGFSAIEHKPRLLLGWVAGKASLEMEKVPEKKVLKQIVEVIQQFLGNSYNITAPTGMIRSMWNTNRNFMGTYSYRSMKTEAENAWPSTLAEPIGDKKPTVLFAGEGTTSHLYRTVNGPIETGWAQAERIIKYHQVQSKTTAS